MSTPLVASDGARRKGANLLFVWADRLVRDDGSIQGAIAAGHWNAVFEAGPDDSPQPVETPR